MLDPLRPKTASEMPAAKIDNSNVGNAAPPPPPTLRVKPEAMENYEQTLGKKFIDLLAIQGKVGHAVVGGGSGGLVIVFWCCQLLSNFFHHCYYAYFDLSMLRISSFRPLFRNGLHHLRKPAKRTTWRQT